MTDRLAFLAAICETPADDAPRLVYADWLDEHEEADRAEFIRVQCELAARRARIGTNPHDVNNALAIQSLALRERELWNAPLILRELPDVDDIEVHCSVMPGEILTHAGVQALVRRGFPDSVTCTAADWLAHGDALSWSPKMTCERCAGTGEFGTHYDDGNLQYLGDCEECDGTGTRPCPATAQPITEVRLTTWQHWQEWERFERLREYRRPIGVDNTRAEETERILKFLFPAVEKWHLPPEPRVRPPIPPDFFGNVPVEESTVELTFPDELAESPSAAPPDNARRRPGHSRMPGWLADQRSRPGRR